MNIGRIGVVAVALCLALITESAQSQGRSRRRPVTAPSTQLTQRTAPDQRGTDQMPLTVKVLPAPDAKEKADKEERERAEKATLDSEKTKNDEKLTFETQRIADYTDRLALFTFFLFCVAVLQAGLFIWQLWLIRKSLDDAKIAADAAASSAKTAAIQAEISGGTLKTIQDTAERQLRAYISLSPKLVFNWRHEVNVLAVGFDTENHGQTVALNIAYDFAMAILDSPLPAGFIWPKPDRKYDQNNSL